MKNKYDSDKHKPMTTTELQAPRNVAMLNMFKDNNFSIVISLCISIEFFHKVPYPK